MISSGAPPPSPVRPAVGRPGAGPPRGKGYGYGTTVLVVMFGLRVAHHRNHGTGVSDGRRPACAVDHVQDATETGGGEEDRERILDASRRERGGNHERVGGVDVHALIEVAVASHAPGLGGLDIVGDPDGRVSEC